MIAPNGRTANPAANARSAKMKPLVGFSAEKNCLAITAASEP